MFAEHNQIEEESLDILILCEIVFRIFPLGGKELKLI